MIKHNMVKEQNKGNRKRHKPLYEKDNDLSRNLEFIQQEINVEA